MTFAGYAGQYARSEKSKARLGKVAEAVVHVFNQVLRLQGFETLGSRTFHDLAKALGTPQRQDIGDRVSGLAGLASNAHSLEIDYGVSVQSLFSQMVAIDLDGDGPRSKLQSQKFWSAYLGMAAGDMDMISTNMSRPSWHL